MNIMKIKRKTKQKKRKIEVGFKKIDRIFSILL